MNGCIIPGTNIAVDFWKIRDQPYNCRTFFLTHLHGDHVVGLTSSWKHPIYCTEITAILLGKRYGLNASILRPLEVGASHMITTNEMEQTTITVTVIDANHCPGAAMFLFEGDFGKILHTGDFRYHPDMFSPTSPLSSHIANIDVVYLDNTFCSPECVFPTRDKAQEDILSIIRQHPDHDVVIGMRQLGKEKLLLWLAEQLQEWISVSGEMFEVARILDFPQVFRVQDTNCRIRTVPFQMVCKRNMKKWNLTRPTIAVLPTSIYTGIGGQPFVNQNDVFVVPYSDHSSYAELTEFVSKLKCSSLVPIVSADAKGPFNVSLIDRADMSVFNQYCNSGNNQRSLLRVIRQTNGMHVKVANQTRKPKVRKLKSNLAYKKNVEKGVHYESLEVENHFQNIPKARTSPKEKQTKSKHNSKHDSLVSDLSTEKDSVNKTLCPSKTAVTSVTSAVFSQKVPENRITQEQRDKSSDLVNLISDPVNETYKEEAKNVKNKNQCFQGNVSLSPSVLTKTKSPQSERDTICKSLNSLLDPLSKSADLKHKVEEEKNLCSQTAAAATTAESKHDMEIKNSQSQGFDVHHLEHVTAPPEYKHTQNPSAVPISQEHPAFPESQGFFAFKSENEKVPPNSEMCGLERGQDLSRSDKSCSLPKSHNSECHINSETQPPQAADVINPFENVEDDNKVFAEDQKVCDFKEPAFGDHIDYAKESCELGGPDIIKCVETSDEHDHSDENGNELSSCKSDDFDPPRSPLTCAIIDLIAHSQQKHDSEYCDQNVVLSDEDIFNSDNIDSQGTVNTNNLTNESMSHTEMNTKEWHKQSPDMLLGESEKSHQRDHENPLTYSPSKLSCLKSRKNDSICSAMRNSRESQYFTQPERKINLSSSRTQSQSKFQYFVQKLEQNKVVIPSSPISCSADIATVCKGRKRKSVDRNSRTSLCSKNVPYDERSSDDVPGESGHRSSVNKNMLVSSVSDRQAIKRRLSAEKSTSMQLDTVETEYNAPVSSARKKRPRCDLSMPNVRSCLLDSSFRLSVKPLTSLSEEETKRKSRKDTILCLQNWLSRHK